MDGKVKSHKYLLTDQPASVHSYANPDDSDSPRRVTSPTSLLRKYPHSLRHDQKHRDTGKRYSSPIDAVARSESIRSMDKIDRDVKSSCLGGGEEATNASDESARTTSRLPDNACNAFESVTGSRDPIGEERSEGGVSYAGGEKDLVLKLHPDSVNININDCKTVHNFVVKSDNANSPEENVVLSSSRVDDDFAESELERSKQHQGERFKLGSLKKLSVINNSLREFKNLDKNFRYNNIDKLSESNGRVKSPVHKSTPNLLPSEGFGMRSSISHPGRITTDRLGGLNSREALRRDFGRDVNPVVRNERVALKGSDSLPLLNQRYRFIHSLLPKLNRPVSESGNKLNPSKSYIRSDTQINSNLLFGASNRSDSYQLLSNSIEIYPNRGRNSARSEDESETVCQPDNHGTGTLVRMRHEKPDVKNRWPRRRPTDLMPSLKNLMIRRHRKGIASGKKERDGIPPSVSVPLVANPPPETSKSYGNLHSPVIRSIESYDDGLNLRKSGTMYSLTNFGRANSALQLHPVKAINRLRVPPNGTPGSRICSRCSSLLSMASSSRYSINTAGSGFIPCGTTSETAPEPNMMCKLCLSDVPLSQSISISQCGCVFCTDCMRLYVESEIQEGAYNISCPDAQCQKQGIMTLDECEQLVSAEMMERFLRFRLNHEVYLDKNRTWCPSAGCETVCSICPREKCAPTSVHCPTCDIDFCSNCKNPWHEGLTCEQNSKKLAKEGNADFMDSGIPYDSDLIKCCPMCNVPIEKDEGCAQMMCKKCKHVFCWYCLASLDDDFLLRHYDKGPCKNKLGHSRASVIWHRTQVIGIFAGFGILLLIASPLLLIAAPCIVCCKCRVCSGSKIDSEEDLQADPGP